MLTSAGNVTPSLRWVRVSIHGNGPISSADTWAANRSGVMSGQMSLTDSWSSSSMV